MATMFKNKDLGEQEYECHARRTDKHHSTCIHWAAPTNSVHGAVTPLNQFHAQVKKSTK